MSDVKIDEAYFDAIKYGDFQKEFEKLGIPSVWQPGTKKADMIQEAIKQLATLKNIQKENVSDEEAQKILEIENQKRLEKEAKLKEEERLAKEAKKQKEAEKEHKKVKKANVSKDTLLTNLANIDANLKNNPSESVRLILLKKKEAIIKELG